MIIGDCNVCINGKMPSYSATCVECGLSRKNYKPMTNADRIRSMSDEELAECMAYKIAACYGCEAPDGSYCKQCWLDWLRGEKRDD